MARLRRKLDIDAPRSAIQTVRGVGFVLREGTYERRALVAVAKRAAEAHALVHVGDGGGARRSTPACLLWALHQSASRSLNERLRGDFQWAAEMAEQRPDGTLTWFETTSPDDQDLPWLQVWSPAGQLIFRTAAVLRLPIAESESLAARADNSIAVVRRTIPIRVLSGASKVAGKPVVIQVARSEAVLQQTVRDLMLTLLLGLPIGGCRRRSRRLFAGAPRACAGRADRRARAFGHGRSPWRAAAGRQPERRTRHG